MNALLFALAALNLCFVLWRGVAAKRQARLFAAVWFILTYFGALLCVDMAFGERQYVVGFTGAVVVLQQAALLSTVAYVLLFNVAVALGEATANRVSRRESRRLDAPPVVLDALLLVYLLCLLLGAVAYGASMAGADYRQYVEADEANWGQAVLFASTPGVVIALMRHRWLVSAMFCAPFLYFAVVLQVRSFLLLSVCPAMAWLYMSGHLAAVKGTVGRRWVASSAIVIALLCASVAISIRKTGSAELPERQLTPLMVVAFQQIDDSQIVTGWRSLELYLYGVAKPIYKALGVHRTDEVDTPVIIAQLVTGHARYWEQYFHYPLLWYTDAYIGFRWMGLLLGVLWGVVFVLSERFIRSSPLALGIFLPSFCWHSYMVLRGAPAIASGGISSQLSIQIVVFVFAFIILKAAPIGQLRAIRRTHRTPLMASDQVGS